MNNEYFLPDDIRRNRRRGGIRQDWRMEPTGFAVLAGRLEHPFDDFLRIVFEVQASVLTAHKDESIVVEFHCFQFIGVTCVISKISASRAV